MEIRYTERKPSEQAADFARDNGLTIKRLQKGYYAYKDGELFVSGSSYGVLLNRMRERVGTSPVRTVDVSPSLKHVSTEGPFRVSSPKISLENLPKAATGELEKRIFLAISGRVDEQLKKTAQDISNLETALTPKIATGELLDRWLGFIATPCWTLSFSLDGHTASASFRNRSNAVTFSRSQANAARRAGRTYTSRGIRYA